MAEQLSISAYDAAVKDMESKHNVELSRSLKFVEHQLSLQAGAESDLRHALESLGHLDERVATTLLELEGRAQMARRFAAEGGSHKRDVWKPTDKSAVAAQKVFGIPELLEQVLSHLDINQDILYASQATRATKSVVKGSPQLQQRLGLVPNKDGHWYTAFRGGQFPGFSCSIAHDRPTGVWAEQDHSSADESSEISASFGNFHAWEYVHRVPRVGKIMRSAQVCTPSIHEMQIKVSCCDSWRENGNEDDMPAPKPIAPLHSKDGITVGNLVDTALHIAKEHQWCPYGHGALLDKHERVRPEVLFEGKLKLKADDPEVMAKIAAKTSSEGDAFNAEYKPEKISVRMEYAKAKRAARIAGEPIPTFSDYTAAVAKKAAEGEQHAECTGPSETAVWERAPSSSHEPADRPLSYAEVARKGKEREQ